MDDLKIKTPKKFAEEIEEIVWKHDIDYIDAVVFYCEKNNFDIENAASLIKLNDHVKSNVRKEAEALNYLPKIARLPL